MSLPHDAKARKAIPVYSGFIKYFPRAIIAIAELSQKGNDQHNPGKPLHWDRTKSQDELDALMRHTLDEVLGEDTDTDGVLHATKRAWRAMADLEKKIERRESETIVNKAAQHWPQTPGGVPSAAGCAASIAVLPGSFTSGSAAAPSVSVNPIDWQYWPPLDRGALDAPPHIRPLS